MISVRSFRAPSVVVCAAIAFLAVTLVGIPPAYALKLKGSLVSNGGQRSGGPAFGVLASVGQPVVGGSAGASFFACHGFWCFGGSRVVSVEFDPTHPGSSTTLPTVLEFSPPAPNPARDEVRFNVGLPRDATVTFAVFDVAGRQLGETVSQFLAAGRHQLRWSAPAGRAGVYFGRLSVEGERDAMRRIILVK